MTQEKWRGIGKLIEECGEVLQLLGKVIPFPDGPHPDGRGALRDRLPIELADLKAAIHYFETENKLTILEDRARDKLRQFHHWGLTGIMDLRAPVLTHDMDCALHVGKDCDCGVGNRTTGPAPAISPYPYPAFPGDEAMKRGVEAARNARPANDGQFGFVQLRAALLAMFPDRPKTAEQIDIEDFIRGKDDAPGT